MPTRHIMKCTNDGYNNEKEFVEYLNGKKIREVHPLFRELIDYLYPNCNEESKIKSWRNRYFQKIDIFIKIDGITKGISIKKGSRNSVHTEKINDFIYFLIENKVSKKAVIEYLKYQYADGSINGKGKYRKSIAEYKKENQEKIDYINKEFNRKDLVLKAIDKFVLCGNNSDHLIDAIVYGTINDFIWASKEDIKIIILSKIKNYSTAVHFGSLTCQSKNRCLNYNPFHEKDRFYIQIKWYNLFDEIIERMNDKVIEKCKDDRIIEQ